MRGYCTLRREWETIHVSYSKLERDFYSLSGCRSANALCRQILPQIMLIDIRSQQISVYLQQTSFEDRATGCALYVTMVTMAGGDDTQYQLNMNRYKHYLPIHMHNY